MHIVDSDILGRMKLYVEVTPLAGYECLVRADFALLRFGRLARAGPAEHRVVLAVTRP
jgi:hypothetical protein